MVSAPTPTVVMWWHPRRLLRASPALVICALIIIACVAAPLLASYGPLQQHVGTPFTGPSGQHWFGTDNLGRDLFSRVLYGGRISLLVGGLASALSMMVGTAWGLLAATSPGWGNEVLMRLADTAMAVPQIVFALVCAAAFGTSVASLSIIIGLLLAPTTARMARAAALTELTADYVVAARAYGASRRAVVLREVLPNMLGQLIVQFPVNLAAAVMLEATLSFVGLGLQPPSASWGTLLRQGYSFIYNSVWFVLFPALAILLLIWACNAMADRLGRPKTAPVAGT